ncbi:DUF1045 domain-containing protein [Raineyella sp. W15-4]|uniref:DUF1045 domain-containing protein n=1 Tax=Raineyella sp. W15-4 TaxID=3081651 RepID=UPI002952D199|nr:DUF1045 domain-containing protein [Raineyella sp. W15-4]WOQ17889.1 DUF1045 domain-containing protein [Raineyella sp. W15-4]
MTVRYAVYGLPGALTPDPLRLLAEAWIGRSVDGRPVTAAVPAGWTRDELDALTVDARRYGFHATLKAPFRLADGRDVAELDVRVARLAADLPPVVVPRIALRRLGGFYALIAGAPAPGLHALAAAVVRTLDDLRAPLTAADRARRHPERLSPRQRALLDTWGYPYVLDEFLAHLTLTDRIDERDRPRVSAALAEHFTGHLDRDVPFEALCVFVEPAPGAPFTLRSTHPLGGTPTHPSEPAAAGHREGEA